jgi:hypothetical protein
MVGISFFLGKSSGLFCLVLFYSFFFGWGGGGLLGLLLPGAFGCNLLFIYLFGMTPFLRPPLVRDTPYPHCSGLYTLNGFLRHVKKAQPFANFIS